MQVTIIESDVMVSELLKTTLHDRNFGVTMCSEQSLKEVCASHPDILIVDMGNPYELGVQFCENVLRKFPECRLLPMTGRLEHPDGVTLSDGSSVRVLQKPFSLHVMLDKIESLAVQCRQHDLVSGLDEDVDTRQIRHEMRNVAMVVRGSATLLRDAAAADPALEGIADKVDSACDRGFDEITLALLQQHCQTAIGNSGENILFRHSAERMLRSCGRGIEVLSEASSLHLAIASARRTPEYRAML